MNEPGPVEYASMDRRRAGMTDLDFACGPCATGRPAECGQGCRGHVPGAFDCVVCAVPVRKALTVDEARRDLERRYVPAWMYSRGQS